MVNLTVIIFCRPVSVLALITAMYRPEETLSTPVSRFHLSS